MRSIDFFCMPSKTPNIAGKKTQCKVTRCWPWQEKYFSLKEWIRLQALIWIAYLLLHLHINVDVLFQSFNFIHASLSVLLHFKSQSSIYHHHYQIGPYYWSQYFNYDLKNSYKRQISFGLVKVLDLIVLSLWASWTIICALINTVSLVTGLLLCRFYSLKACSRKK